MEPFQQRLISFARRNPRATAVVNAVGRSRARKLLRHLRKCLPATGKILDIGVGSGHMAETVGATGHQIVGLDVTDLRFVELPLVVADGAHLPFADGRFDAALLLTVLHHVPAGRHAAMLREGMRVVRAKGRLLVLEDVFHNGFERAQTLILDMLLNGEFFGHPHANRSLAEWERLTHELGFRPCYVREFTVWYGLFRIRHALFAIERT